MSDPTWIEFNDLDAEVNDRPVTFADTVYVVNSMRLSSDEELDLRLALAFARDCAREKNVLDDKDSYWAKREVVYANLLQRLNNELIPF